MSKIQQTILPWLRGLCLSGALLGAAAATEMPEVPAFVGTDDPVIAFGLSGVNDWGTAMPFLDIMRVARPFTGVPNMEADALRAGGHLDAEGWPVRIPEGTTAVRTLWDWWQSPGAAGRAGRYHLTYEGLGRIAIGGAAQVVAEGRRNLVFETAGDGLFWLDILETQPSDPIRNIRIVHQKHRDLDAAGALFNPTWTARIADAREIRFMDWMGTNNSTQERWADRPRPEEAIWTRAGIPLEVMIRLANEIGADPWFTLPHAADDGYVRAFAETVRAELDPRLKAHVEYSNEVWNPGFQAHHWLRTQSAEALGVPHPINWHAKRATEMALLWDEVFGAEADARLVHVVSGLTDWHELSEQILNPEAWAAAEPERFQPPAEIFDELALTTYFGGSAVGDAALRPEFLARIEAGNAADWLTRRLLDPQTEDGVAAVGRRLEVQAAIAERNGLRLTLYEGGQHIHHSWAIEGLTDEEVLRMTDVLSLYTASAEMATLYEALWDVWVELGDGPFMQYGDVGRPSRWGSFAPWGYPEDRTGRGEFFAAKGSAGGSWWGEGASPAYGHGVVRRAGPEGETLIGTGAEDYLLGGGGDDLLVPGGGADGIWGGAGTDTVLLAGEGWQRRAEGVGQRLTGPGGTVYLVGVERVAIDGAAPEPLDTLPLAP